MVAATVSSSEPVVVRRSAFAALVNRPRSLDFPSSASKRKMSRPRLMSSARSMNGVFADHALASGMT